MTAYEFGVCSVWVTAVAPMMERDGEVAGAVTGDVPVVESASLQRFHSSDMSQNLTAMLQAASVRWGRAEVEAISDCLTGLYNHRYLQVGLDEEIGRAREEGALTPRQAPPTNPLRQRGSGIPSARAGMCRPAWQRLRPSGVLRVGIRRASSRVDGTPAAPGSTVLRRPRDPATPGPSVCA